MFPLQNDLGFNVKINLAEKTACLMHYCCFACVVCKDTRWGLQESKEKGWEDI